MFELLNALKITGLVRRRVIALAIWIGFATAMVGIAAAQAVVEDELRFGTAQSALVLIGVWVNATRLSSWPL